MSQLRWSQDLKKRRKRRRREAGAEEAENKQPRGDRRMVPQQTTSAESAASGAAVPARGAARGAAAGSPTATTNKPAASGGAPAAFRAPLLDADDAAARAAAFRGYATNARPSVWVSKKGGQVLSNPSSWIRAELKLNSGEYSKKGAKAVVHSARS